MERLIRHLESLRDSSFKVTRLDLRGWNLTEIPWIPARCIRVNLSGNRLTSLPELPDIIEILDIGDNMITEVVKWPKIFYGCESLEILFDGFHHFLKVLKFSGRKDVFLMSLYVPLHFYIYMLPGLKLFYRVYLEPCRFL